MRIWHISHISAKYISSYGNYFLALTDEIIISTGWEIGAIEDWDSLESLNDTTVIKMDKNGHFYKSPCQLPDYPLQVMGAKGTMFSSNFNVCGGRQLFYTDEGKVDIFATDNCYSLDLATNSWKTIQPMMVARDNFAMTSTNENIFVCGGTNRVIV